VVKAERSGGEEGINKTEAQMLTPEEEIIPPCHCCLSELTVLMRWFNDSAEVGRVER